MAKKESRQIDKQIKRILSDYRDVINANGVDVEQMILFGSWARGKQKEWSDIDVAVVSSDFGKDYFDERVELSKMALGTSTAIEPHPFHPRDLQDRWSTIAAEINRYGITIE